MKSKLIALLAVVIAASLSAGPPAPAPDASPLQWDAEAKESNLKAGETSAAYTFCATNTSKAEVSINALHTSCGCTVAQLPSTPYKLAPGSNVTISVALDVTGKTGRVTKSVTVDSSAGIKSLLVSANIPANTKPETK